MNSTELRQIVQVLNLAAKTLAVASDSGRIALAGELADLPNRLDGSAVILASEIRRLERHTATPETMNN